jgi:hypothetical protein
VNSDPLARLRAADPLRGELPAKLACMPELPGEPGRRAPERLLVMANAVLLAVVLLHSLDHTLQDRGIGALSFEVMLGGFSIAAIAVLSLVVAWRHHGQASLVALVAGPWVAVLVVAGHFVPYWSEFSDPYADAGLGPVSYAVAAATAAAGIAVGAIAAWARLRVDGR